MVLKSVRSLAFMSVRPVPMRRPAGSASRRSSELDAWLATFQTQARLAAQEMSAFIDREVACEYPVQRHGPARTPRYRFHHNEWNIEPDKKRKQVSEHFLNEQSNDDARSRALTRPGSSAASAASVLCSLWCGRALEAFHKAANDFVGFHWLQFVQEFSLKVQCVCPV